MFSIMMNGIVHCPVIGKLLETLCVTMRSVGNDGSTAISPGIANSNDTIITTNMALFSAAEHEHFFDAFIVTPLILACVLS